MKGSKLIMRKKHFGILLVTIFLLSICQNLFAQKSGSRIGKLDLLKAIVLHPSMVDYDTEFRAFKIQRDESDKNKVKKANDDIEKKQEKLRDEMKKVRTSIKEENERHDEQEDYLKRLYVDKIYDVSTGTAELAKANYYSRYQEETVIHEIKLRNLYGRYASLEEDYDKLDNRISDDYTSAEETEKKIDQIVDEIKKTMKKIADKKGISIVLNSRNKKSNQINNSANIPSLEAVSLDKILNAPFPAKLAKDEAAVKGYYLEIESKTQNWLDYSDSILGSTNYKLADEDILLGGEDLTYDVLSSLYSTYKIDPNISKAVLQCIKK